MVHLLPGFGKSVRLALAAVTLGALAFSVRAFGQVPALSARLLGPIEGVATDGNGNVFVALPNANIVVRVDPAGILTVAAGTGTRGNGGDNGPPTIAQLNSPTGVAIGPAGALYIAESESPSAGLGTQIRLVSNGVITTVAGGGSDFESDNIPATSASLSVSAGNSFAADAAGNLYIASFGKIRKVSNGVITTLLNGLLQNPLVSPQNIALDAVGNVYFTDSCEARVYKLANGLLTTFAGSGKLAFFACVPPASTGDGGPATSASLYMPSAITIDGTGAVYVMEQNPSGDRVRRISNGIITAFAGGGLNVVPTYTNDNIPATSAFLVSSGEDIAADPAGNLYIGDAYFNTDSGRVREVSGGIINTVAGAQGSACPNDYLVTVSPALFSASGGNGNATFVIDADASCGWNVIGLPAWITFAGPGSGTGPASVQLNVLTNPGAERSATFQVAGVFVTVTQGACTYSLDAGGQVFPAQGGNGTITIITGAGCPWTAGTPPAGVTFTSPPAGAGSGAVSYQVLPNGGGTFSVALTIAGQIFTIEQQTASIPGLTFVGSMPHLAAQENWTTTFTLVNQSAASATARLSFFGDDHADYSADPNGNGPLMLYLTLPQQTAVPGALLAASFDRAIGANASLIATTAGPQTPPVLVGSGQLAATGAVDGFAIFHQIQTQQEAVVPMETRSASSYLLPFDNSPSGNSNLLLGVALTNISAQAVTVQVVIRDDTGALLPAQPSIQLPAGDHFQFGLADQFPVTANIRGTVEFDTPSQGQISVLGLRFTPPNNALTTIPALANVGTGGGSIAHLASGGDGWQTTFVLINAGTTATSATLSFFADQNSPNPGGSLPLPLTFPQGRISDTTAPSITEPLAAGATLLVVSSQGSCTIAGVPAVCTGAAQLTSTGNVSGFVIFRHNNQEAVVPLESRNANAYVIAFDNTNSTATGIAVNSVSASPQVSIPVVVRDDAGNQIATDTITMAPNGHSAFTLGVDRFQNVPNILTIRGTIEFDKPVNAQIGALGIRIPTGVAHTFTTLPALAK
jgi:hypothetical protein